MRLNVTLPAEPESLPGLRRRLGRFLHAAGATDAEQYEITLTVCEAAGNAIEHAYGPGDATFELRAGVEDGRLRITVRDYGDWRPPRGSGRGRGLQMMSTLVDEVDVRRHEDGTEVVLVLRLGGAA